MANEQAKFKFKGYRITKSEINIADNGEIDRRLNVVFSGIKEGVSDSVYTLDLGAEITNETKNIDVKIEMRGYFDFEKDLSDEQKTIFFTGSAPAIMFPYLRAYISTVTGISGIEPIILPTINFSEGLRRTKR